MRLAETQQALAASLTGRAPVPPGCDARAVERAACALEAKRRRVAAHVLAGLKGVLGESWRPRFHEHASAYHPAGMLFHIDDAWAFALSLSQAADPAVRQAARNDLAILARRYVRRPDQDADRIVERVSLRRRLARLFERSFLA